MKLLLVDDCLDIIDMLASLLESTGHETDKALNGKEAVALLQQNSYDIVITDALMPEMDGFELCKFVKFNFPGMYIIGITGSFKDLNKLKDAGADVCFSKPFRINEIEKTIEEIEKGFISSPPAEASLPTWRID